MKLKIKRILRGTNDPDTPDNYEAATGHVMPEPGRDCVIVRTLYPGDMHHVDVGDHIAVVTNDELITEDGIDYDDWLAMEVEAADKAARRADK